MDEDFYTTPSSSRSRRSHPFDMSPSSSPPPLPSDDRTTKRRSHESVNDATDESISPLDPRRFTPTLHASLVSEILSLRRDLEGKVKDIDQLELSLHATRTENNALTETLALNGKETRSLKRQMHMLEGGTQSAIAELTQEKEDAHNETVDLRRRLEQTLRRAKNHEDEAERTQARWDQDKENWQVEKRHLETRVHIVEGRIKAILNEMAQLQAATTTTTTTTTMTNGHHDPHEVRHMATARGESPHKRPPSAMSLRRHSATSNNSDHYAGRASALGVVNGLSIADELAFDEEDEEENDHFGEITRHFLNTAADDGERPLSSLSVKARKVLGINLDQAEHDVLEFDSRRRNGPTYLPADARPLMLRGMAMNYVDSAAQYSPPPSPKVDALRADRNGYRPEPVRPGVMPWHSQSSVNGAVSPISSLDSSEAPWNIKNWPRPQADMVSASCQTVDLLPEHTPAVSGETSLPAEATAPTAAEDVAKVEMCESGTQTEVEEARPAPSAWSKAFDEMLELSIPTIAIIPPASRPATPETNVVLPPRTKNAGCQVEILRRAEYISTSTQTPASQRDSRAVDAPVLPYVPSASNTLKSTASSRSIPPNSSRRRFSPTPPPTMPPTFHPHRTSSKDGEWKPLPYPPDHEPASYAKHLDGDIHPPVRSSSLFAGFDDELEQFDDSAFEDDDIFRRPTAKFVLRSGKLISQEPVLEDIGENPAAASAGEAVALSNLRLSEDTMRSEGRPYQSGRRSPPRRPIASSKAVRRVALVSTAPVKHQSSYSQATSFTDSVYSSQSNPPPFPVPNRFSSRRPAKSLPEDGRNSPTNGASSPTKRPGYRSKRMLRKARSGPAISPGPSGRRARSRSPPVDPRVSILPELPSFQMPESSTRANVYQYQVVNEASAPRPSVATGPASRKASHLKTNSDAVSLQQTSVVDSIARTMVGEWMYKYVRRRKSFGMPDAKPTDFDPSKNAEELSQNLTTTGVRHKRWVWLAPYERAVMWSSKQPANGAALLGKSGRKLTIQSVLDVKDDNPMPKGSIAGPHFNRSILILTPQRALKFTATSQERHYVWLTALSFLSHSPLALAELQALPPPPSGEQGYLPPPSQGGSLRQRQIRDSIRVAKNPGRFGAFRSFTTDGSLPVQDILDRPETYPYYDPATDPALPPVIARFHGHTRKRSNTAPRGPPSAFRTFSPRDSIPQIPGPSSSTYSRSNGTTTAPTSSDRGVYTPSIGMASASSRRGSEASATSASAHQNHRPAWMPAQLNQLYERGENSSHAPPQLVSTATMAVPSSTMRMDAFVDASKPTMNGSRAMRKDGSYWGLPDHAIDAESGRNSVNERERERDKMNGMGGIDRMDRLERTAMMNGYVPAPPPGRSEDPFHGF